MDRRAGFAHAVAVDERDAVFEEGFDQCRRERCSADEDRLQGFQCRRIPGRRIAQCCCHLRNGKVMGDAEGWITEDRERPLGQEAIRNHEATAHHQGRAPDRDEADRVEEGKIAKRHGAARDLSNKGKIHRRGKGIPAGDDDALGAAGCP